MKRETKGGKTRNNLTPQFYGPPSGRGGPWRQNQMTTRTILLPFPAYYVEFYTDAEAKGNKNEKQWFHSYRCSTLHLLLIIITSYFSQLKDAEKPAIILKQAAVSNNFSFSNQWHFILYQNQAFETIPSSHDPIYLIFVDAIYLDAFRNCWQVHFRSRCFVHLFHIDIFFFFFISFLKIYFSLLLKIIQNSLHPISNSRVSANGQ